MQSKKMTLNDAYTLTYESRKCIRPNDGFMEQLIEFEKSLFGGNTTYQMLKQKEIRHSLELSKKSLKFE